jgi:hypothetical protein
VPVRAAVATGLHAGIERVEPAAGREEQRELLVDLVDRRLLDDDAERGEAAPRGRVVGPQPPVQPARLEAVLVEARPLDPAQLVEAGVAHPGVHRREPADLVPHVLGGLIRLAVVPGVAELAGEVEDDLDVVAGLARRVERLAAQLHPAFGVGHRAVGLAPRRRAGQHDVGELGGLGEEEVLDDEVVEAFEGGQGVVAIGLGLSRVLPDHVQRPEVAAVHRLEHLGQVPPVARWDRAPPLGLELRPRRGVGDVLEAGQLVRQRSHVAAALDVVLPAQRVEPRAVAPDVSAQQGEVDEAEHVVDGVVVLGDAERPAQLGPVGPGVGVGELADRLGRHAGDLGAAFERPLLDRRGVLGVAGGGAVDEVGVDQSGVDDLAGDRVGQGDVGADVQAQPHVGELGRRATPGVDDVQGGAVADAGEDVVEEDRVGVTGVRAPHHDHVGGLDLGVRGRATTRSEDGGQTDHRGRVSSAVARVDVVRADHRPGELLGDEVHLVGRLGAGEEADGVGPGLAPSGAEAVGSAADRLFPRRRAQLATVAHQRLREPGVRRVGVASHRW